MRRETDSAETVRRKVDRLRRARGRRPSLFRALAHVGVLGWQVVLPLIALTALGHSADVMLGTRSLALSGLVFGLVLGGYLGWRSLSRELEGPPQEHEVREEDAGEGDRDGRV